METQPSKSQDNRPVYSIRSGTRREVDNTLKVASKKDPVDSFEKTNDAKHDFNQASLLKLAELLSNLQPVTAKKSFLVFKNNRYLNVLTENIAMFYIKYQSPVILCFDNQEFFVNYSLDQLQQLLCDKQFFRLNRQYLVNFNAVKEVEHYFARKLLVNPVISVKEKLIVSKEKVTEFLHWLDNR